MTHRNPDVDAWLDRTPRWREEMTALREHLLACDLREEIKWGKPCYTADGANIAILQPFKDHLALMFFKGALLDDPAGVLRSQGANTRSAMRVEFTSLKEVGALASAVGGLVRTAIEVEAAGLTVPPATVEHADVPAELAARFERDPEYQSAFEALTPGRKRSHLIHISGAKRSDTRARRVEKCRETILAGKGFNEA